VTLTYALTDSTAYTVKITFADATGTYVVTDNGNPAGSGSNIAIADGAATIDCATGVITFTTAPAAGVPIVVSYTRYEYGVTPAAGTVTSALGSFTAVIMVPTIAEAAYGNYLVTAIDTATNTATATLAVNYYLTLTPPSGPTGITTTIAGRIKANTAYEVRFNTVTVGTGTSAADGKFENTYVIPAVLSTGPYTVEVVWDVVETRSDTFTVTAAPQVTYGPLSGSAGAVITISSVAGFPFSGGANITLYLGTTIVNSTQMDARFGPTVVAGPFKGSFTNLEFTVPALAPGVYALKVVDEFGASTATGLTFTILATPESIVELRGTTYYPMDTLSFNIWTTETSLGTITVSIYDPSGILWWRVASWPLTTSDDGTYKTVLFEHQGADNGYDQMKLTLPADAPVGSWNWTVTYKPTTSATTLKATGLFTVAAATTDTVINKINQLGTNLTTLLNSLEASIVDVVTDSEGDLTAVINTKAGQLTTKLDAIGAQVQGIEDMSIIIATDVGEIKVAIEALDLGTMGVDITAIKGDVATIKTNLGTLTTSVASLDAKVVALDGDVATISTNLGTLEGKVTDLDGKVATVNTSVGSVQADVSDIKAEPAVDMTPVWIAVVLSLIAAIAAIFAVVTIRQKIAG
jgi:hypothetical protein